MKRLFPLFVLFLLTPVFADITITNTVPPICDTNDNFYGLCKWWNNDLPLGWAMFVNGIFHNNDTMNNVLERTQFNLREANRERTQLMLRFNNSEITSTKFQFQTRMVERNIESIRGVLTATLIPIQGEFVNNTYIGMSKEINELRAEVSDELNMSYNVRDQRMEWKGNLTRSRVNNAS